MLTACCSPDTVAAQIGETMSTTTLQSDHISGGHCAGTVLDAVRAVPGVETVSIDIQNRSVAVVYAAPADEDAVRRALRWAS